MPNCAEHVVEIYIAISNGFSKILSRWLPLCCEHLSESNVRSCKHLALIESCTNLAGDSPQNNHQAPVVQRVDNAIHWINRYPVDKC